MIKRLRKRHLQIWGLLAVLIPAGIISAYIVVPKEALDKLLQQDTTAALPVEIKKAKRKDYTAFLRGSNDKNKYQLQVNILGESKTPSSLIYQITKGEKELIGRVGIRGNYYFSLKADSSNTYNFILYDIIHQQTIDTLKF